MPQPSKVSGLTFYSPNPDPGGTGFIIWALIGGSWQRYEHHDDEAKAGRMTNKHGERLAKCAARRRSTDGGDT